MLIVLNEHFLFIEAGVELKTFRLKGTITTAPPAESKSNI